MKVHNLAATVDVTKTARRPCDWGRAKLTNCNHRIIQTKITLFKPYIELFGGKKGIIHNNQWREGKDTLCVGLTPMPLFKRRGPTFLGTHGMVYA